MMITTTGYIPQLSYRLYKEADMKAVLELWEKYSGWGKITEEQFQKWYLQTPHGPCLVIVAFDEKENIVGQIVFIPSSIYLEGNLIKALRVSSPILSDRVRELDIRDYNHPVYAMLRQGMLEASNLDYRIVYMFPAKGWTSLLRTFPKNGLPEPHIVFYDCYNISLEDTQTYFEKGSSLTIHVADKFNDEYSGLWERAKDNFPIICGVVRDIDWIKWKLSKYLVFEGRDAISNQLQGFVAINKRTGLVIDMLGVNTEILQEILLGVIKQVHYLNREKLEVSFASINGMATPNFMSIAKKIPGQMKNFTFAFACYALTEKIQNPAIHPSKWFMMPND